MGKIKETAQVIAQEKLCDGIYSMLIRTKIAKEARCGQFISVYTKDSSRLLPRPISICEIFDDSMRIVYRVAGEGTNEFSKYTAGDDIEILGPNGNGFPTNEYRNSKVMLIGGGIGIPPMLCAGKAIAGEKIFVCGYRNKETMFITDELEDCGKLYIATDDGSYGVHGTVMDVIARENLKADVIFACGPKPMLAAVKAYSMEAEIPAYISMEERMACGVGACLGCVCTSTGIDDHSKVNNKRVCKDGPVFLASEVEL